MAACVALPALAWLLMLHVLADVAWARAGGGQGYGGGGSGGGGFGGGGGDGELLFYLIWLCFRYPLIGVPLLAVVLVMMYYGSKTAHGGYVTRTIRRGLQVQHETDKNRAMFAIQSRDPAFDEEQFLSRVSAAFVKIQHAWSTQQLAPVRAFISDGIHERFSLQIAMQKSEGIRNQMDNVRVREATIAAIHADDQFDTIHVILRASADDYNVRLDNGRRVGGDQVPSSFSECWSFHRRRGTKTLGRNGAMEGNCPNCAAPLKIVDQAKCTSCNSTVNSGEHDWVLAEITQSQEWRVPDAAQKVPGLDQFKSADPGFSVQHVEDRVSVMFWRLKAAEFFSDPAHARPVLADEMAKQFEAELKQKAQRREFYREPAVGTVELIDVQPGAQGEMDRLRVMVRWSGTLCARSSRGRWREVQPKRIKSQVYVLDRRPGARSVPDRVFSSAACTQCGAPIAVSKEAACQFCGTKLVDGRHDWILLKIEAFRPGLGHELLEADLPRTPMLPTGRELNGQMSRELSLAVLAKVMHADGRLTEKERASLSKIGARRGLSPGQIQTVIATADGGDVSVPQPRTPQEARGYLRQLVQASLVDGRICRDEKRLLGAFARKIDFSPADVRMEIARERRRLYQDARAALKGRG